MHFTMQVGFELRSLHAVAFELLVQALACDAEAAGGGDALAGVAFEGAAQHPGFESRHGCAQSLGAGIRWQGRAQTLDLGREHARGHLGLAARAGDDARDLVLELAHVAGPGVGLEQMRRVGGDAARYPGVVEAGQETLRETMARLEAWVLRGALEKHDGRRIATARMLGITRECLYKKLKRYKMQ